MPISQLGRYIERLTELKEEYRGQLDILIGLEVDYIRAFEHETKAFLDQYGTHLDDSILSVHFCRLDLHTSVLTTMKKRFSS